MQGRPHIQWLGRSKQSRSEGDWGAATAYSTSAQDLTLEPPHPLSIYKNFSSIQKNFMAEKNSDHAIKKTKVNLRMMKRECDMSTGQ